MAAARFASHAQLCRSASPCSQVRSVAVARYDEEREEEGERGLFFFLVLFWLAAFCAPSERSVIARSDLLVQKRATCCETSKLA